MPYVLSGRIVRRFFSSLVRTLFWHGRQDAYSAEVCRDRAPRLAVCLSSCLERCAVARFGQVGWEMLLGKLTPHTVDGVISFDNLVLAPIGKAKFVLRIELRHE